MRRASAMTTRSGVSTRRTDAVGPLSSACTARIWRYQPGHRTGDLGRRQRHTGGRRGGGPQSAQQPPLPGQQPLEVPGQGLREREQPQRLGGRGAVDDDEVPVARTPPGGAARAARRPPRRRAARSAPRRRQGRSRASPAPGAGSPAPPARSGRAYAWRSPAARGDPARPRPVTPGSVGALRRSRPSASPSECAASVDMTSVRTPERAARTAHAAAVVVLPTPPLPVKRTTLGPSTARAQPSTRFFSSRRAVSTMTFSALRLSMPSMGIVRSTASR